MLLITDTLFLTLRLSFIWRSSTSIVSNRGQNIKLILINSKDLPFMHILNKEMLLLKSNRVIFKKKALEKLVSVYDMFLK